MSRFVDFKAVKAAVSLPQVLERYGLADKFKRTGDSLSGPCPLHNGENPTQFRVSINKNCWHCFGRCNDGGNVLEFVARKESVSLREAALMLCEWFQLPKGETPAGKQNAERRAPPREKQLPQAAKAKADAPPEADDAPNKPLGFALHDLDPAHRYLAERGLSKEAIAEFGLGYCQKGSMTGRIVIPIYNAEGQLVAYAGRYPGNPPEDDTPKYKLPPGFRKAQELFNYHRAIASEEEMPLVVVEGFFDAIKLYQFGYRKVVALMGSSLSQRQEEMLCRLCETPDERVILFFDNDDAGRKGQADALKRLSARLYVHVVTVEADLMQPEQLSLNELRFCLPFPDGRDP